MRQFKRSKRVGSQMLRDVQQLLDQECTANLKTMVTFTGVEVSDDLRYAKIYYTVLGGEDEKKKVARYLKNNRKRVRFQIGRLLGIKATPEIGFKFDPSIERGMRIEKLLNEVTKKNNDSKENDI